jgi:hypothetical protein
LPEVSGSVIHFVLFVFRRKRQRANQHPLKPFTYGGSSR